MITLIMLNNELICFNCNHIICVKQAKFGCTVTTFYGLSYEVINDYKLVCKYLEKFFINVKSYKLYE